MPNARMSNPHIAPFIENLTNLLIVQKFPKSLNFDSITVGTFGDLCNFEEEMLREPALRNSRGHTADCYEGFG